MIRGANKLVSSEQLCVNAMASKLIFNDRPIIYVGGIKTIMFERSVSKDTRFSLITGFVWILRLR